MSQYQKSSTYLTGKSWTLLVSLGVSLIFLTMPLYAAKPDKPGGGGGTTCTITTTPDPAVINEGQGIDFSGSVSGRGPAIYSWIFTGVDNNTASSQSVTIYYAKTGDFSATLNGENGKGDTCTATTTITVNVAGLVNKPPVAVGDDYSTTKGQQLIVNAPGVLTNDYDADDDTITAVIETGTTVNGSNVSLNDNGSFTYTPNANFTGSDSFTYTAFDGTDSSLITTVNINVSAVNNGPAFSINSTSSSQTLPAATSVAKQEFVTNPLYQIVAINDLGMHCGDLDTRISSILPPFNVLHAQVVERGTATSKPRIMNQGEVKLYYSAVSNANDPVLSTAPVLAKNGSLYKTNFWDIARQAYDPFYPEGVLAAFYPAGADIIDIGLPVPDVERLYLEDGNLHAGQQAMPGLSGPLAVNKAQLFVEHIGTLPFFTNFYFGYTSDVNWSEAAGIPMAVYDDSGRKNPYPLMRVHAEVGGTQVATVDTVVPISGEAECQRCHADLADGGNGAATQALYDAGKTIALASDDPAINVPSEASIEWASDINIIALHDLKHETTLSQGYNSTTGKANEPVVCQTCHYTPALDLAQLGPLGPENDGPLILNGVTVSPSKANGRDQAKNKTMSNVMHSHHGQFTSLFPTMPPPVDAGGNKRDPAETKAILGQTCYSCHPGNKTECMRGAMANGGLVCQDCHGNMEQVGDDFSRNVSSANVGAFEVKADFYDNILTPRVPWANEPGCGSCHTGSAIDNLTADNDTLVNPTDLAGNTDGIRLAQAFRTDDDKATPIVPVNKMFAENVVAEADVRLPQPEGEPSPVGNPKLYRVSTGHGGLFCEGCHGATHAEWPNAMPGANDNVASLQIQGHTGTISECTVCHEGEFDIETFKRDISSLDIMQGPHGMHPVDSAMWNEKHKEVSNINKDGCKACHGPDLKGTVLSRTAADRDVRCKSRKGSLEGCSLGEERTIVPKGTPIGCGMCHAQKR